MSGRDEDREEIARDEATAECAGPWRFWMKRERLTVADGVRFGDGTCVLRWRGDKPSTATYETFERLVSIHGHPGTLFQWVDVPATEAFRRGLMDCVQDLCENAPFGSVGGLDKRAAIEAPRYVSERDREEYLRGYVAAARREIGTDWQTCAFSWAPAFVLNPEGTP